MGVATVATAEIATQFCTNKKELELEVYNNGFICVAEKYCCSDYLLQGLC